MKVLRHARRGGLPRYRLLAAILSVAVIEVLRHLSPFPEAFTSHVRPSLEAPRAPCRAGKDPFGEVPFGNKPQDTQELFKQMFGQLGQEGAGAPGAGNVENPFAAMFGGAAAGQPPKKTTDTWFLNKLPVLKRIKRPVLIAFFAFCLYRGWVGRWGFVFGCMAESYFDMLAVPLRVSDRSPFTGRAYVMTQLYVSYFFKLIGYIINVAKGKAKFPPDFSKMLTPPAGAGAGTNPLGANPFAAGKPGENPFDMTNPFDVSPVEQYQSPPVQPTDLPTAPTVGSPPARKVTQEVSTTPMAPLTVEQVPSEKKSPGRSRPPVVDADVTFLD